MTHTIQRLSAKEKIGYGLGDAATNFFFMSMLLYQGRYYTDVVGLSAASVGWMLILVRWVDAVFDPIIGALSDRTQTRWGKFRPWVLWSAVPFALIFWLAYTSPNFSYNGKFIYSLITYLLLMVAYSANNTPYSALTGVMTSDPSERTSISTYRLFIAILVGQLLIQGFTLPLVDKFGHGNAARGWSITMGCFAILMVIFYLISFASTRERVQPKPGQKTSFKSDLVDVFSCQPWIVMFLLTLFLFTTLALRGGSFNYYFNYYMDRNAIMAFLQKLGFATSGNVESMGTKVLDAFGLVLSPDGSNAPGVCFSLFNLASNLIQIPGILMSKSLADRFGKRNVFLVGLVLTTIVTAAPILLAPDNVGGTVLCGVLWGLFWGPTVPLLWAMIADVPDYAEWKTTRRATGFAYAGIVFALKAGLGIGGALSGWVLSGYGYVANAAQSEHSLLGIRLCSSLYSALPFVFGIVVLFFYPITKELAYKIETELLERRKNYGTAAAPTH